MLFFGLCSYLVSQAYSIPVIPMGPWAIWLTLSDFAAGLLLFAFLLRREPMVGPSRANRQILTVLVALLWLAVLSYVAYLSFTPSDELKGVNVGIFQIYSLVKFICIFWVAASIPLSERRIGILLSIVTAVAIFSCIGIIATYFDIIPITSIAPHLPKSPEIAGPWHRYGVQEFEHRRGWGTIGYNHAQVAAQVLLLIALRFHLSMGRKLLVNHLLLVLGTISCFLTDSRAGLAGMFVFAAIHSIRKPVYATIAVLVVISLGGLTTIVLPENTSGGIGYSDAIDESIKRQQTLAAANDAANLSGRREIWLERLAFLNQKPHRWLVGSGFGSAVDGASPGSAHMLYLHVVVELGLVGLVVVSALFVKALSNLARMESSPKPVFWATVALLLSSFTQETFYPVPAMGHFLGFYLCTLAIVCRQRVKESRRPSIAGRLGSLAPMAVAGGTAGTVRFLSRNTAFSPDGPVNQSRTYEPMLSRLQEDQF